MSGLVLLVEDNEQIQHGNERMLRRNGYEVMTALTIEEAQLRLSERMPDVIVLDIMLPDGSGLNFMRDLRRESDVPVLLLTGLTTPQDVVRGLSEGGDDYLAKPYDFDVLLARIEALLRRAERVPKMLIKGGLKLDIIAGRAFLSGDDMQLTHKEFSMLLLLAQNEGRALDAEYIYENVWKQPMTDGDSAVKTVVSRLRKKLSEGFFLDNDRLNGSYTLTRMKV